MKPFHLLLATLILFLVLVQPNHPHAMTWGALGVFPLELPFLVLALLALGQTRSPLPNRVFRVVVTTVLSVIVALKTADFVSFTVLSRGFNPIADVALVDAFVRLIGGTFGVLAGFAAVLGALLVLVAVGWLIWWATGVWAGVGMAKVWARASAVGALVLAFAVVSQVGMAMGRWQPVIDPPGAAFTARLGVERVEMVARTLRELRAFRAQAASDPFSDASSLFDLVDRDVLVIFVESYGRTSFDTAYYAQVHRQTLETYQSLLGEAGLATRSGFLTSPTRGGQSWLAHATFANGLWVDSQVRYGAALASGRQSLFHHAARSGLRTAAVMPQITLDWPESQRMGFDQVLAFDDLGYNGPAFNWVAMPDQFTLAQVDGLVRSEAGDGPLLAQVVLVSSHAPWTPVPDILPWEALGDGTVYAPIVETGATPREVWQDHDRVREQYRLAVDYALRSVFTYALKNADEPPLMIIVGDHQAADFVSLDERNHVPLHVIGPAHMVQLLSDITQTPGLLPGPDAPVLAMETMRDALLNALTAQPIQLGAPSTSNAPMAQVRP